MKDVYYKFHYIYLPFLYIALACFAFCTLFNLLLVQTGALNIWESIVMFWLPIGIPVLPLILWLWRRIKFLQIENSGGRSPDMLYFMLAWAAIAIPNFQMQKYIIDVTGELINLQTISQLPDKTPSKFYNIKNFSLRKNKASIMFYASVMGKHDEYLKFEAYAVIPVYDSYQPAPKRPMFVINGVPVAEIQLKTLSKDLISEITVLKGPAAMALYGADARNGAVLISCKNVQIPEPKAWLGWINSDKISNNQSEVLKEKSYDNFRLSTEQLLETQVFEDFTYLRKVGNNDDLDGFKAAIAQVAPSNNRPPLVFLPEYSLFEKRGGNQLSWIVYSFLIGNAIWFTALLIPFLRLRRVMAFIEKKKLQKLKKSGVSF